VHYMIKENLANEAGWISGDKYCNLDGQSVARYRTDKHPAIHARNSGTTRLCNPLLRNGSVNKLPRRRNDVTFKQY
jgi:hypothetical protein